MKSKKKIALLVILGVIVLSIGGYLIALWVAGNNYFSFSGSMNEDGVTVGVRTEVSGGVETKFLTVSGLSDQALEELRSQIEAILRERPPETSGNDGAEFSLKEHERLNTIDAVFKQYSSVRQEYYFSDLALSDDGWGELAATQIFVAESDGISIFESFFIEDEDIEDESLLQTAYVNGNIFYLYGDGSYGVRIYSDETNFEEQYLPLNSHYVLNLDFEAPGIRIVSVSVRDGARTIVVQSEDDEFTESIWGITGATMETVHIADSATGLIQRLESYLLVEGERIFWASSDILYGQDDGYKPEYVKYLIEMGEVWIPGNQS